MAQRTRLPPQFSDTSKHIYHTVPDPNCLVGRAPARWKHEHTFRPATPDGASLGALHMGATLRRELERRRQATLRPGAFDYGGMSGSAAVAVVAAAAAAAARGGAVVAQQEGEEWQPNQPRAAFPRLCRSSTRSARGQKQRQIQHQQQQQQEEEQLQLQQQHQQQQQQQQQPPLMRAMTAVPGFRTPQRGDRSGRSNRSGRGDERPRTSGGGFGGVGDSSSRSRSSRSSRSSSSSSSSSSRAQRRPADPPIRLQHPPFNLDHSAGAVRRQMSWDVQVRERAHLASSQPGYIGAYRTYDANARRLMPQTPKGVGFDPRLDLAEDGRSDVTCWAR